MIWIKKTKEINFQQNTDIQFFFYGVRYTSQSRESKADTDEGLEFIWTGHNSCGEAANREERWLNDSKMRSDADEKVGVSIW